MHLTTTALQAPGALLRAALKLDAVVTGANGIAYLVLAGPLAEPLSVGETALRITGAAFLVFAVGVWLLATADRPSRGLVTVVGEGNVAYAVACVALVLAGVVDPVAAGAAWIVAQAAIVAGFGALQLAGLRRL